jgi:hypothetical protein
MQLSLLISKRQPSECLCLTRKAGWLKFFSPAVTITSQPAQDDRTLYQPDTDRLGLACTSGFRENAVPPDYMSPKGKTRLVGLARRTRLHFSHLAKSMPFL